MNTITKQLKGFSVATRTTTKRGRWLSDDYFDVSPTNDLYHPQDIEVFRELMRRIKDGDSGIIVREVIKDAARKMDDVELDGKTRRWVAYGFMNMVSDAVIFFANHADWEPWLQKRLERNQEAKEASEKQDRERMANLTRLSVEARQRRRPHNASQCSSLSATT